MYRDVRWRLEWIRRDSCSNCSTGLLCTHKPRYAIVEASYHCYCPHPSLEEKIVAYLGSKTPRINKMVCSPSFAHLLTNSCRVESIGSYVLDRPLSLQTSSPDVADGKFLYPSLSECAIPDIANASISRPLIGAYRALQTMNEQLSLLYSTLGEHTWQDPAEIDKLVDPVTRQLLAASCRLDPQISIGTCVRSAAMLYLAEFRRRSGISPVIVDVHVYNLRKSWEDIRCCVPMGPIFRLWLFTLGSMESTKQSDASYFLQQLRYISKEVGITSLAQYRGTLTRVLWFDPVFEQKLGIIHRNLQY